MKDDKWISDAIYFICMMLVVVAFFFPAIVHLIDCKPSQEEVLATTPSAEPAPSADPTPIPPEAAESTPVSTPEPTAAPDIPHIKLDQCIIVDADAFYSEVLDELYDTVSDIVCLQIETTDGECYLIILAKIDGKWQVVETSQG